MIIALSLCMLVACGSDGKEGEDASTEHVHVADGANCQEVQYCADCGELMAENGPHAYPEKPTTEQEGFAYYVCPDCGTIKVVNTGGLPVVPVE